MHFGLSEEHLAMEQSLTRYVGNGVPTSRVREVMASPSGHDPSLWRELAELGVPGLLVPESLGGDGLTLLAAVVVARVLGWGAVPAPFVGSAVMAPVALSTAGSPEQKKEWLPRIAAGSACFGISATEIFSRRDGAGLRIEGGALVGRSLFVVDAAAADAFLVAASPDSLALVPRDAHGLTVEPLATVDPTRRVAELGFDCVRPAEWVGGLGGAATAIERMLDAGRTVLAADILGCSDRALSMAVEYAKVRKQFGRLIGSFQAVKHMCAEMAAELEPARSLVWYAAHAFDAVPEEAALVASHAKAHLAEIGTTILETATEVHGGIGFTYDFDLHIWFKRVLLDRQLLGAPDSLRARAAELQGW